MDHHSVFVTGATGFLGHHLIPLLRQAGYRVRALARRNSDTSFLTANNVEIVCGDVRDRDSLSGLMKGCAHVIHAAAFFRFWGDENYFEQVNVQGTVNVLEAAARNQVERFIHISSVAVIGLPQGNVIDEAHPCNPLDPYQKSKLYAEKMVKMYHEGSMLPTIILRPGAFYGPWSHYAWNRLFFEDPMRGLLIKINGGKHLTFPVYVPDVARSILLALLHGTSGETYNISGDPITHNEANRIISDLAGLPSFRLNLPSQVMLMFAHYQTRRANQLGKEPYYPTNLAKYVFYDWNVSSQKAHEQLNFTPTLFEDGARETVKWYRGIGMLKSK